MTEKEDLPSESTRKPRIFYGYIIVGTCFVVMTIMHGVYNTFGVFFTSLESDFGISRAVLSGANSFAFLIMGVSSIIAGTLADRLGPRKVLTACAIIYSIGFLLLSRATTVWQLYLFSVLIGIGLSSPDIIPLSIVVRWFVKKRGVMSGIMKVGTGAGMAIFPMLSAVLIKTIGWRNSYLIIGILVLVTIIPLAQLLRRDPREKGLLPDGEDKPVTATIPADEEGLSLGQAIRTRQFWLICCYYFSILFCGMTLLTHLPPHASYLGMSDAVAAGVVSLIGVTSIAGRLVMGFTGDRIGQKRGTVVCLTILVIALMILQVAHQTWTLYLFAAIYGFNHGGFFALISPLIAGLFGTRSQGSLLGTVIFCGTIGGSVGLVMTGYIFDIAGNYYPAFIILLAIAVIGLISVSLLKPITKGKNVDTAN